MRKTPQTKRHTTFLQKEQKTLPNKTMAGDKTEASPTPTAKLANHNDSWKYEIRPVPRSADACSIATGIETGKEAYAALSPGSTEIRNGIKHLGNPHEMCHLRQVDRLASEPPEPSDAPGHIWLQA